MKLKKLKETLAKLEKQYEDAIVSNKTQEEIEDIQSKIDNIQNRIKAEEPQFEKTSLSDDGMLRASQASNVEDYKKAFGNENELTLKDFTNGFLFNNGEAKEAITKVNGSAIMPSQIVGEIIHKAVNKSVFLKSCPILPMSAPTATIGRVKDTVSLDFKEKFATGQETGLNLEGVKLEAKTLYGWIRIAEEDLEDLTNLDSIIKEAFSQAVAETLDKNFLYTNEAATTKEGVYPQGILDNEEIKKIEVDAFDYDALTKGVLECSYSNEFPNTVGLNPKQVVELETLKDTTGQYLTKPPFLKNFKFNPSNAMKRDEMIMFDPEAIVIGIRKNFDIKIMPSLTDGTVLMRCMVRADIAIKNPNAICKIVKKSMPLE